MIILSIYSMYRKACTCLLVPLVSSYRYNGPMVNMTLAKSEAKILYKGLKSDSDDHYLSALRALVKCFATPNKYFEKVPRLAINKLGTNENALTCVVTTQAESANNNLGGNLAMDSSYPHNYGRFEDSHNSNVNRSMTDEEELCSTQPIFNQEEDVSVDTLKIFEVNEVTNVEDYLRETSEECEVFQIEPEIVIALNEGENEMKIYVISDNPEKLQIESEEDQPLVLVQPPTLACTFGTPYKGVEVKEHSQIFYIADTFVLDDPDAIDSFVLEVLNKLLNLKDGLHASLPKYVDAPFVVDISKGEGIT
ncbi:hypothetical protein Syun_004010 [Stephania yunnanensis]|uniref:Uncharacterized protein n=1 Tax=Stephania yunnanensis TaxID=152371 RepID=A0AAP0L274_9MAGN